MDVNASSIAMQTAVARQNAAMGFIKQNIDAQGQMANILTQAAEQGAAAASGGRGNIVDISA